ncbi:MAG: hypothetical protein ABI995_02385 [Acidobacteriota bacterium]
MKIAKIALFFATLAPLVSQTSNVFRAKITTGDGDRGKCTVEVVIHGTAEVEIQQTEGRLRSLDGVPIAWRRMECNMPFPDNPDNLQFVSQTGRGRQYLLREPSGNRGIAVIRIEDPDRGNHPYKFTLEWQRPFALRSSGGLNDSLPKPDGLGVRNWNQDLDFQQRGSGYYRTFRSPDDELSDLAVRIDRAGHIEVSLTTARRERLILNGTLTKVEKTRLLANITSGPIQGPMELHIDARKRVQDLTMTGTGRNRFELRWQPK